MRGPPSTSEFVRKSAERHVWQAFDELKAESVEVAESLELLVEEDMLMKFRREDLIFL